MSLAFLSPGPQARSPLAPAAAASGGTLGVREGWELAVRFAGEEAERRACAESVGWADCSHRRKLEAHGDPSALRAASPGEGAWFALAPRRALVLDATGPIERDGVRAIDITCQLAAIALLGPLSRELLARFCSLDLRPEATAPGQLRPGSVARTPGYVLCEAPSRYLLMFGAAYGQYVWEVVCDAGGQLGGAPVGADLVVPREVAVDA